ncbi:DegT/DnrJ/EryC1/StrS family aminotransferase [Streptomyces sp. NPDC090493]|uniref:DegT/DnrJ/EryC1/StrS family aminotransferase n=1 Tax=Streptomyces sp. NPDC090493 TaxID=3365964 RepID=UPI0038240FCB
MSERTITAVDRYLRDGGPLSVADGAGVIGELERRMADVLGVGPVLTFSSGTAALHAGYLALDLPPGSTVIGPVNTFHASLSPALHAGLNVVLVDVDPETGTLCPQALAEAISEDTACVTVSHHLGHPAEMDEIVAICRERRLRLVEDCSHAYLSTYKGRPVGSFGDLAVWSMQARKRLCAGEGGLFAARDRALYERAVLAGHYRGRSYQLRDASLRAFADTGLGLKYRLHPLGAVIALAESEDLAARVARRDDVLQHFSDRLSRIAGIRPPIVREHVTVGGWFSYRPRLVPGEVGPDVTAGQYLAALQSAGVPAHCPSVGSLDQMALFSRPAPLRVVEGSWRPRLHGPFDGDRAFDQDKINVTIRDDDDLGVIDGYVQEFAAVSRRLGTQDAR